ncbi:MAG: hypothetical protein HYV76_03045 [Candidatus Vogelbacteria bacterium]|nr:hypothetical protein [Candidatus Vogelbacteria bacterium]
MSYGEYKQKISQFYNRHRRLPSYSEIMSLVGFKSKNAVYKLVQKMLDEGVVNKDHTGHLVPGNLFGSLKLLGIVEAGIPTSVEAVELDTVSLDEMLVEDREHSYLLTVKGDSMMEAGIYDGDLVLADKSKKGMMGDIVIAEIDGGWTMKYLKEQNGQNYLEPANSQFKNIYPKHSLNIAAVVTAIIRQL